MDVLQTLRDHRVQPRTLLSEKLSVTIDRKTYVMIKPNLSNIYLYLYSTSIEGARRKDSSVKRLTISKKKNPRPVNQKRGGTLQHNN